MGKAILVMDTPDSCSRCDLYVCYRQYAGDKGDCFCGKTKQNTPPKGVPSWCPLKSIPEKKPTIGKESESDKICMNAGWNACIDAICGKE